MAVENHQAIHGKTHNIEKKLGHFNKFANCFPSSFSEGYPLVMTNIANWNITVLNGKIHVISMAIFQFAM